MTLLIIQMFLVQERKNITTVFFGLIATLSYCQIIEVQVVKMLLDQVNSV